MPPASPRTESVSRPVEPERGRRVARARTAAAARPSPPGSIGGSARSSPRSRTAPRAGSDPSPPSRGSSRCRTPCRRARASGRPVGAVALGGLEDARDLAARQVGRPRPLGAGRELVAQADVRERAAHHHLVVAAPGPVGVEVDRLDAPAPAGTRPAGESALIEPAGEMWSVVIESPTFTRTRAPSMSADRRIVARAPRRTAAPARRSSPGPSRRSAPAGVGSASPALVAVPDARVLARRTALR